MNSHDKSVDYAVYIVPSQTSRLIHFFVSHNFPYNYYYYYYYRFCLAEVSCVQEDLYPSRCKLVINGRGCTLPVCQNIEMFYQYNF